MLVAGFGNLAGDADVYDLKKDYKKITTFKASNASICDWSPDGQYLLTAITSPRLRVDNGVRIWHISGSIIYNDEMNELYHVTWRPQSTDVHPLGDPFNPIPAPHESALEYLGKVKTPTKPVGAYRPPGARGTTTPLAFMREDQGGAAYVRGAFSAQRGENGFGLGGSRSVPGAEAADKSVPGATPADGAGDENLSAAALKNKKKREAKKAKAAAEKAASNNTLAPEDGSKQRSGSRSRSKEGRDGRNSSRNRNRANSDHRPLSRDRRDDRSRSRNRNDRGPRDPTIRRGMDAASPLQSPKNTPNGGLKVPGADASNGAPKGGLKLDTVVNRLSAAPDLMVTTPGGGTGSPQDKKVRSLTKKLRAIDELKMRRAGGEKLEATQIQKMSTEESIRKELSQLGWSEG